MEIYYRYSKHNSFDLNKSDYNNEYGIMLALNQFADVYYSGKLFQPDRSDNGMGGRAVRNVQDCDLLYSRAAPKFFDRAEEIPRFIVCFPYDHKRFRRATGIMTYSEAWRRLLVKGVKCQHANPHGRKYKNVYVAGQVAAPDFKPLQDTAKTKAIRKKLNAKFVIGYFGRMLDFKAPWEVLESWELIQQECPGTRMILAWNAYPPDGEFKKLPDGIEVFHLNRKDVPYYMSACDVTMNLYRGPGLDYKGSYRGSMKTLESMACGVPVICHDGSSREEQLGEDYPLFIDMLPDESGYDPGQLLEFLHKLYSDREFSDHMGSLVFGHAERFRPKPVGRRLKKIIEGAIE